MKKLYSICSLLLVAVSMAAQISFFETYQTTAWSESQQQMIDTSIARIHKMFDYTDVDSINIKVSKKTGAYQLYLWKNENIVPADSYIAGTGTNVSSALHPIDSIVWHSFPLRNVNLYYSSLLPIADLYGNPDIVYYYPVELTPKYATFTQSVSNTNPAVAQVEIEKEFVKDLTYGMIWRMYLKIKPLQMGNTTVTVTFNDSIVRTFDLEIGPREEMWDETYLSLDSLLNKIYSRLAMTGDDHNASDIRGGTVEAGGFFRCLSYLQDLCTDQLYWIWNEPGIGDVVLNRVTPDNSFVHGLFRRLYYNIWLCNSYLSRSEGIASLASKRAEARFMRAYFYYYLLDMYGNVPIVTDNTQFFYTPQSTRAQLYQFVESELLAAEADLLTPAAKTDYYHVDKAAAWLLLSRLYLNGVVYAGANDFTKAAQYAHKVIQSSYDLASNYKWLFMGDNDKRSTVNDAWKEIILPARQEGDATDSYTGSLYIIAAMSSGVMPATGLGQPWACILSRAQLPKLFFSNPATAAKGTADVIAAAAGDDRALFCNSYNGSSWGYNNLSYYDFSGGWAIQKWNNLMADQNYVQSSQDWPDTDLPLMRKAEAYLNYAEAVLRGGATVNGLSALDAVNTVRQRANATPLDAVTLDDLLDERGREFYSEGYRRTDLIRFGKFGGNTTYQWEWKNGVHAGSNFDAHFNLYPIPASLLNLMFQGTQNEGY